jgi:hypothetical protein
MSQGDEWQARYRAYLRSPRWQEVRRMAFAHYGRECQWCGATRRLQVHHLHYHTLGRERPEDLEILCPACHADADIRRTRESERRAAVALYRARLSGWASRKYGEDWASGGDWESIAEEFAGWIETKE